MKTTLKYLIGLSLAAALAAVAPASQQFNDSVYGANGQFGANYNLVVPSACTVHSRVILNSVYTVTSTQPVYYWDPNAPGGGQWVAEPGNPYQTFGWTTAWGHAMTFRNSAPGLVLDVNPPMNAYGNYSVTEDFRYNQVAGTYTVVHIGGLGGSTNQNTGAPYVAIMTEILW